MTVPFFVCSICPCWGVQENLPYAKMSTLCSLPIIGNENAINAGRVEIARVPLYKVNATKLENIEIIVNESHKNTGLYPWKRHRMQNTQTKHNETIIESVLRFPGCFFFFSKNVMEIRINLTWRCWWQNFSFTRCCILSLPTIVAAVARGRIVE